MAFEVRLLGSVEALVDGHSLALGGSKQRSVVAMLALHANRTVSADTLIDGLWAERPPDSAAKNVQLHVSRLRKAFASDDCGASIVTHGRGYELRVAEGAVDALRFEHLVEEAARGPASAGTNGAASAALELWRGAPLADVASEPFAGPEIGRLEELHLRAVELAIDAELAAGRHGAVIGRLQALIAEHPLNERFHGQRMLALYRAGRRSEALDAYRQAHRTLTEEIGIEPGAELRQLQEGILAQDPALDAPAPPEELPRQLEGGSPLLAGRDAELGWLRERWQEARSGRSRVALVSGPSGIGKTRLVAELAAEVHRTGATILYAAGSGAPEAALDAVRAAGRASARRCSSSTTRMTRRPRCSRPRRASPRNRARRRCSSSRSPERSREGRRSRTSCRPQRRSVWPWIACRPTRPPRSPPSTRPPTAWGCRWRG